MGNLIRITVEEYSYGDHADFIREWLINPDYIAAIDFRPEKKNDVGEVVKKFHAVIFLSGVDGETRGTRLIVTDSPSIDRLLDLERT